MSESKKKKITTGAKTIKLDKTQEKIAKEYIFMILF